MNKNTHGYMTVWYTKGIYVSFVNCFVVILPHHKNVLLLALTLDSMIDILLLDIQTNKFIALPIFPIHIIYVLIFPIIRDPGPRYKWVGKSLVIILQCWVFTIFLNLHTKRKKHLTFCLNFHIGCLRRISGSTSVYCAVLHPK